MHYKDAVVISLALLGGTFGATIGGGAGLLAGTIVGAGVGRCEPTTPTCASVPFVTVGSTDPRTFGAIAPTPTMEFDVSDIDHVAIRVSDIDRALGFYHDLLGLPVRDRERFEAGGIPFVAVVAGGRHLHLVPTDDEIDVGGEHVCLLLRSNETDTEGTIEELLEALREADIEVEEGEPIERLGAYGRDWAAYVRDPDGRRVELKFH